MNKTQFDNIVKTAPYHIFIFVTRPSFPLCVAVHPYIVTVAPQATHRREINRREFQDAKHRRGHLHLNYQKPREGRFMFPWSKKYKFQSKILFHLSGDEKARPGECGAATLIQKIENQIKDYPYKNDYHLLGINSNSFIQRIINQNPKLKVKLPWNAFGTKNFIPN